MEEEKLTPIPMDRFGRPADPEKFGVIIIDTTNGTGSRKLDYLRAGSVRTPPPTELAVMIECIRASAQDTLAALHARGWKLSRTCED